MRVFNVSVKITKVTEVTQGQGVGTQNHYEDTEVCSDILFVF